jgi:hypothetical protein
MIKLKEEINKTATMQELRKKAEQMYKHTYEGKLRIEDFMSGANTLFNLLRLPRVSVAFCGLTKDDTCDIEFSNKCWCCKFYVNQKQNEC